MLKKRIRSAALPCAVVATALVLGGCYPASLNPLAGREDRVSDERLIGQWRMVGGDEVHEWTFADLGEGQYSFTWRVDDESITGEAVLTEMEGRRYLDCSARSEDLPEGISIAVHQFLALEIEGDLLRLSMGVTDAMSSEELLGTMALEVVDAPGNDLLVAGVQEMRKILALAQSQPGFEDELSLLFEGARVEVDR